ncbi:MAG: MFS transporter [Anaerovoracaceae bacterium]
MKKLLNFDYACIQGTYWMLYGILSSFASVFLLSRGYSNSEIGVILAAANVAAVVLQPLAADLADRSGRVSLIGITQWMTVMMMVMTIGLFTFQKKSLALSAIFVLLIAWHTILQPLVNSLNFRLQECGVHINFGMARSLGSLAYSILMAVLGTVVENHGTGVLPVTGEIVMVMLLISLFVTKRQYDKARRENLKEVQSRGEPEEDGEINLISFVRRNKVFFIVNIGVVGLYFSNSVLNNYMMQIVSDVGGNSEDMGRILSLMAFLEIPTMFCFDALRRRFSCQLMLKAAAAGFTVKIALCWAAQSVAMIFAAHLFQLVSFALFLPAMVHFIDEIMSRGEAVKGQALFTTMITVTTVFSSLVGGVILDLSGAKMLTLTATLVTAVGAVIIFLSVDRVKTSRS